MHLLLLDRHGDAAPGVAVMLQKIVSGGQTGVDQAALRAARAIGLATGGRMPLGYRTLAGPRPDLAVEFGLTEHESQDYAPRTSANVRESDATLRIAVDFASAGERCTMSAIVRHERLHLDVAIERVFTPSVLWAVAPQPREVASWLVEKDVVVLNVAGNSELTAPGIGAFAERYLRMLFSFARGMS